MTEKQKQAISILNKVRDCMKEKLTEEEYFALLYFIVADVQVHVDYPYPQPITPIYTNTTGDNPKQSENTITSDYAEKIPHEQMEGTSDVASSDYIDSNDEEISFRWEDNRDLTINVSVYGRNVSTYRISESNAKILYQYLKLHFEKE